MKILGIDPGTATTGYGIIESPSPSSPGEGRRAKGQERSKLRMLTFGCIRTQPKRPMTERLSEINDDLTKLIKKYRPQVAAVESVFFYKNITTAISVAQARGVMLLCVQQNKLRLLEFSPLQVKRSLTGYGKADKKQVQYMVKTLLNLKSIPKPDDAADALALALCAATHRY